MVGGTAVLVLASVVVGVVLRVLTMVDFLFPQTAPNVVDENHKCEIAARVCVLNANKGRALSFYDCSCVS